MNRFIEHSQVVITTKYKTVTAFHTTNHSTLIYSIYFQQSSLSVSWQKVSLNHTLPILRYYSTFKIFKSHVKSSNSSSTTNFTWLSLTVNCLSVMLGTLLYSCGTDTHHMKHGLYCYVKRGTTWPLLLCYVTAHTLYSNGPCEDTKETSPQHCWATHTLERPPWLPPSHNVIYIYILLVH
jgi:hypothetical protein